MSGEIQCFHDKVYSSRMLMSNPPLIPWICRTCGTKGTETCGNYYSRTFTACGLTEYDELEQKYKKKNDTEITLREFARRLRERFYSSNFWQVKDGDQEGAIVAWENAPGRTHEMWEAVVILANEIITTHKIKDLPEQENK